MLTTDAIRRAPIKTDLDQPNRPLPISSFFIHLSNFMICLWFLAKSKNADAKRWHGAAVEKEQPQVDPLGAARQRRRFGIPPKGNNSTPPHHLN